MEPDKKEASTAKRGLSRVCCWKATRLNLSLEQRLCATRMQHTHDITPSTGRKLLFFSLSQQNWFPTFSCLRLRNLPLLGLFSTFLMVFGVLTSVTSWGQVRPKTCAGSMACHRGKQRYTLLWGQSWSKYSSESKLLVVYQVFVKWLFFFFFQIGRVFQPAYKNILYWFVIKLLV